MRELTFKGFLKQYVYALSSAKTYSLYKLSKEAATVNPRLREPLFLYALFHNKEKVLINAVKDYSLRQEYSTLLKKYDIHSMKKALESNSTDLPERFLRVYSSYKRLIMRKMNNNYLKSLMYKKIITLQVEKNISNYRLYTDLNLNPSNINSFLKTGNVRKVSQSTAKKMIAYLEKIA